MFVDWAAAQQQPARVFTAAYYADKSHPVLLQEISDNNCRCMLTTDNGTCTQLYVESKFSCGSIMSYDEDDILKESPAVAKCQFNENYFTKPISYKEMKAVKIGVFHATCTLQKDIEKCDPSLSEGMQLSVQGDILRYAQLAFEGKPAAPTQDLACKTAPEGPLSSKDDFSNTADPSAASALYSRGGSTYFTGSGDIYTGIFRATQNYQAAADEFGRLQLVYVRQVDSTGLSQPPKGYYVAKPYSLSLQAYKYKPYDEEMYTGPVRN